MKVYKKSARATLAGMFICAAWILGTNAALAGEITGNGKWIAGDPDAPLNGKSACAYSGQQDNAAEDEGFFRGDRTQSWGQIPKAVRDMIVAGLLAELGLHPPGTNCNPTRAAGPPP